LANTEEIIVTLMDVIQRATGGLAKKIRAVLGLTKTLTVLRQTGWQQFDKNLYMIHIWCKFTSKQLLWHDKAYRSQSQMMNG
jgi:hypothetical protein